MLFLHDCEATRRVTRGQITAACLSDRQEEEWIKKNINHKQSEYRLCSHSLQQSRHQYSFFSRSAKPAGGFKQLHNITAPKIQIHSNLDSCYLKILFLHVICQVFLAVLLCKILESRWVFKSVHRDNVLIFHSSRPGDSVRALTVLIDMWHVNSGSPLSFPVCSSRGDSTRFCGRF